MIVASAPCLNPYVPLYTLRFSAWCFLALNEKIIIIFRDAMVFRQCYLVDGVPRLLIVHYCIILANKCECYS